MKNLVSTGKVFPFFLKIIFFSLKKAYIVKLTIYTVEVDAEKRGLTNIKFQKFEKGKGVGPKQ